MKLAYVVPRYGLDVLGGAELGARMLAERLVSMLGWQISVLTTCALDARTWADEYPPGESLVNGVQVRRFRSRAGRDPAFEAFSSRVLAAPESASRADEERWIDLQGPVCPDVVRAAITSDADLVVFYPYLYYPTVRGVLAVSSRAIMHPAAHDEPPLRLPIFHDVFSATRGFVFQTESERRLVEGRFSVAGRPQLLMGLGVEPQAGDAKAARRALALGDNPYVLCLGRVDEGKGTGLLARFFAAYKRRHPGPLKLVYVGPVIDRPPAHPDIVVAGPVDEATKWGVLRAASALVSPAPLEAFSLAVIEAWNAGLPVLVNAACQATAEHVRLSGGGVAFADYATFEVALQRLAGEPRLGSALAGRGAAYATANFSWSSLIERYAEFLSNLAGRLRLGSSDAQDATPRSEMRRADAD